MDIKAKVDEIVAKVKGDPNLMAEFKSEPVKTIEKILGINLPDEAVEGVVHAIKVKLGMAKEGAGGLLEKVEGFFHKK